MLACLFIFMIVAGSTVLFGAFMAWVLREHLAATKYRQLVKLHDAVEAAGWLDATPGSAGPPAHTVHPDDCRFLDEHSGHLLDYPCLPMQLARPWFDGNATAA